MNFACKCCGVDKMDAEFVAKLKKFEAAWNKKLVVNSAYRCAKHNKAVGGKPNSKHLVGCAVDITVLPSDRFEFLNMAVDYGFKGIGIGQTFIHLDNRNKPALWLY